MNNPKRKRVVLGEGRWFYNARSVFLPSDAVKIGFCDENENEISLNMKNLNVCNHKKIRLIAEILDEKE